MVEETCDKLMQLLNTRQYATFMHEVDELNPVDAAEFLTQLPEERLPAVFRLLKKDTAADVFAELDPEIQQKIITAMTDRELSGILEDLFVDDAVDMMEEMPASVVKRIMKNATPETRAEINRFLAYPEDSAGSVMTSEYIELKRTMTCTEAIDYIRKTGFEKETVYVAYVTDQQRILQGTVLLNELLFAQPDTKIEDIMDANTICVTTLDDQETVASLISKYDLLALPVVDKEHRLVGIVTVDDAMDVMQDEVTEDIEKMAAIVPSDKPYLKTGVFETWKKRIPWLLLLMITATFTSTILSSLESKIDSLFGVGVLTLSLAAFVPMLTDTGGNAGSQASVSIIRALSLNEISAKDTFRILWKELRVSFLCGITIAAACFIKVWVVDCRCRFTKECLFVPLIVSLTIFCAIVLAKLVGTLLPMLAKALRFDPAVMASPFITTIVDTLTLLLYYFFVTNLLVRILT